MKKGLKVTGLLAGGFFAGAMFMADGEPQTEVVTKEVKVQDESKIKELEAIIKEQEEVIKSSEKVLAASEEKPKESKKEVKPKAEPKKEKKAKLTVSQENAIQAAKDYLDYTAFSKSGLIAQLEYEKYSKEDAAFAVEQLKVDWREQAVLCAQAYMDYTSFSRAGLIDQLLYEGHSQADSEYAATQVGL